MRSILNVESVVFVRSFCETLQIQYQPFFVARNLWNEVFHSHTTMTTVELCVCWVVFLRTTILAVLMLSIFLCAHTENGIKMVDISTYFWHSQRDPHVRRLLGCDRYCWKGIISTSQSSQKHYGNGGWLWYSLATVEQPWETFPTLRLRCESII